MWRRQGEGRFEVIGSKEPVLQDLREAILAYDEKKAQEAARRALKEGVDPLKAVENGLALGLREMGNKFEKEEVFIPHLMAAAEAMKRALEILEPEIGKRDRESRTKGVVVLGTIEGDLHDIGKNIVALMLEVSGFKVYDLGRDVPVDRFIEKAKEVKADIIGVSALMTTTMLGQQHLVERLKELGLYRRFKVMIGGAAVNEEWAARIQADAYAEDAIDAVRKAEILLRSN